LEILGGQISHGVLFVKFRYNRASEDTDPKNIIWYGKMGGNEEKGLGISENEICAIQPIFLWNLRPDYCQNI